jgi:hypothetical protein
MKTLSTQLGNFIGLGIDVNSFFSITINHYEITLIGFYTEELERKLLLADFVIYDYCYAENPNWVEMTKDGCRISLNKQ